MSNIGKIPIKISEGVSVDLSQDKIKVKGPKGELQRVIPQEIGIEVKDGEMNVIRKSESQKSRELHGLIRTLLFNMIMGVSEGFEKRLKMVGVGYKSQAEGTKKLTISVGYSHPVEIEAPEGIDFKVEKNTIIIVSGIDKELVGRLAAKIRDIRKPEPYKGKGIMYEGEKIRRKAGKALKAGS